MRDLLRKSWPKDVPETLTYRLGEKPLHDYLLKNAMEKPNQSGYVFYGQNLTWKELADDALRLAEFLSLKGIRKGDRVALYLQNSPQYIIGHYAIQMIGAVVVPLNPMYKESELDYFLNEAEIKVVIAGQELYTQIKNVSSKAPSLEFVITTNYANYLPGNPTLPVPKELNTGNVNTNSAYDFVTSIKSTEPLIETAEIDLWNDVGLMVFTSGTTGRPKAAMLTFGNALFKTAATAQAYMVNEADQTLATAPLCHIAGMVMGVNIPVYQSLECVLLTRFEPEAAIQSIEKYKISKLYTVAPMNAAILNHPNIETRNLTSLKLNFATSFGMNVDEKLASVWSQLTDGCVLLEAAYGLSETHTCDTFMPIDHIKFGSCGIATYDTEIRIVDLESGEDLKPGQQGEIVIKSPGVFKGYLNRPEATEETLRDGWVFTGDIGQLDEEGYLYFNGRVKEMIKSSGYSVFPEDVEALMSEHDAILQVACIGVPDATRGESVKAFIVLKPEWIGRITEEEVISWAKNYMSDYKYPRSVEFIEELPATSSGKVLRRLLKEE
ncbi:AMP-binding protein [Piscibacillus salipiscarius]|uniref:AMP-binding protein n=1 Tax=Piscibacillus salipiscarius TaxID=299480 RepID=A0ABW5QCG4_9BACI|nr:AMP-binding protein [Piscibacillus salipiscarius]